jgi:hypothetical protein
MYGSQFVGDGVADGLKRGIRTTRAVKPEVPTIDRIFGIRNRVFTGNPVFQKDS